MQQVTLIGFGAIGQTLYNRLANHPGLHISHIVVPAEHAADVAAKVGTGATVCSTVPEHTQLLVECAGHTALTTHVLPALRRGVETAVLSIGALSTDGMPEMLADAAAAGHTQVHLLAGAIGGVDAIAAAKLAGLDNVTYTGRKPPLSWQGTPAEQQLDLKAVTEPTVILDATAREAAQLYPKNANVAATIALAGLGLDATRVRLYADPTVTENVHQIDVRGAFGEMQVTMRGKPLPDNPKTSALTVLSALRFLHNRAAAVTI